MSGLASLPPRPQSLVSQPAPAAPSNPKIKIKTTGAKSGEKRWRWTKPSTRNAQKREKKRKELTNRNPGAMVIAIPEVRRLLFQHCDNQSLARLIRCKKELVYEASRLLYATMDWKFVRDTLCRKKERTRLYCNAVQTVICDGEYASAGIRRRARNTRWDWYGFGATLGKNEMFSLAAMQITREICPFARVFEFTYKDKEKSTVRIELDLDRDAAKKAALAKQVSKKRKNKDEERDEANGAGVGGPAGSEEGGDADNEFREPGSYDLPNGGTLVVEERQGPYAKFQPLTGTIYSKRRDIIATTLHMGEGDQNKTVVPVSGLSNIFKRVWTSSTLVIRGTAPVTQDLIPAEGYPIIDTVMFEGVRGQPNDAIQLPDLLDCEPNGQRLRVLETLSIPWQSYEGFDNTQAVLRAYKDCPKLTRLNFAAKHAATTMRPGANMSQFPELLADLDENVPALDDFAFLIKGQAGIGEAARGWPDFEQLGVRLGKFKLGYLQRPEYKDKLMNVLYHIAKIMKDEHEFVIEPVPGHAMKPVDGSSWADYIQSVKYFRQLLTENPYRIDLAKDDMYTLGVYESAHIPFIRFDNFGVVQHIARSLISDILADNVSVWYVSKFSTVGTLDALKEHVLFSQNNEINNRTNLVLLHNGICRSAIFPANYMPLGIPLPGHMDGQRTPLTRPLLVFLMYVEGRCGKNGDLSEERAAMLARQEAQAARAGQVVI